MLAWMLQLENKKNRIKIPHNRRNCRFGCTPSPWQDKSLPHCAPCRFPSPACVFPVILGHGERLGRVSHGKQLWIFGRSLCLEFLHHSSQPFALPAWGQSQTHQLHHFLFSLAFISVLEAIPEVGAVYTLEMCRLLLVSFALILFSFCFALLAFGKGCAEPGELNPNPLSSFKPTKIC